MVWAPKRQEEETVMAQTDLLVIPFQPGNLKISKRACLKRHLAAIRKKLEMFRVEDLFNYFVTQGLSRCQECPIIDHPVS